MILPNTEGVTKDQERLKRTKASQLGVELVPLEFMLLATLSRKRENQLRD